MNIVITMAGLGSRFRKAGYRLPKYMIEANGRTLFTWSLCSLKGVFGAADKFLFIVRKEDAAKEFIRTSCEQLGIADIQIVEIDRVTKGQAETAMLAKPFWTAEDGLLIYNIDTYVEPGEMSYDQLRGDGFIPCFHGKGDHWSFVRLNEFGEAVEIREKKRISENCSVGAYYFRSASLYEELYRDMYGKGGHSEAGEQYVAPLYDLLIQKGGKVYISDIPEERVHVLGTPEELEQYMKHFPAGG